MKIKILSIIMIALVFSLFNFKASVESQNLPNWIEVKYTDLKTEKVSEYQLVTVTVKEHGLWFSPQKAQVVIDYDQEQLELVNTIYRDSLLNSFQKDGSTVEGEDPNFEVVYQFKLKPEVSAETIPLRISKVYNNSKSISKTIEVVASSSKLPVEYLVDDIKFNYAVSDYTSDGTTITYNAHFDILDNPHNRELLVSLKKNNMTLTNKENYKVKLRFDSGDVEAIDKTNFKLKMQTGDSFDLNVSSPIDDLQGKDDCFNFFIFLKSEDQFIRLEPSFYHNKLVEAKGNIRVRKYIGIKLIIIVFFGFLASLYGYVNKKRSV